MKINGSLKFDGSGVSQIENLRIEKLASLPVWASSDVGRLVYITGTQIMWIGGASQWIAIATGGNATAVQNEVDAIEISLGGGINSDGTFNAGGFSFPAGIGTPTSFADALNKLAAYASGKDTLAELDDTAIASPATGDALIYTGAGKWANRAPGSASGLQPNSAILDGVVALAAGTGLIAKTAAGTFAARTLTGPAAGLTITNGNGVSGNPTIALANDLAALEGLTTTGYIVRTADGTATTRAMAGTAGNIVITNGNGVSSDTSIDLATIAQAATGNFRKVTLDGFGRVTGNTAVVAADITALVDATYVNVTGDTMSGSLTFSSGTVTGLPNPTNASDAANKAYVDAQTQGLTWKNAVRVATTANISVAAPGATIDGVNLAVGDRILVKNQTAPAENGIYTWAGASTALTRALDMNAADEFDGSAFFVKEGTVWQSTGWTETATVVTIGTSAVTFSQFSGGAVYTWGTGLNASGNTISVNIGAGLGELPANNVGIKLFNTSTGALILTTDGTTRAATAATSLHLLLNGAGGLVQDASGLKINAASVTNAMLANPTTGLNGDTGSSTVANGQTLQIIGTSAQGISTAVSGQTVTITAANASASQKGVASFAAANFAVTAGVVTLDSTLDDLNNVSGADAAATGSLFQKTATTWQPVAKATFLSTVVLNDLSGVSVATPTAGDILVNNGTNFANRKIYFLYTGASNASHTVTHNLNQKYCNVTVVDADDNVVIPESIVFTSATALTVTFNTAIACKVVVMGV